MAAVNSTMLAIGTAAPDFTLTDTVSGKPITLSTYRDGKPVVAMFICNHCPYVLHVRDALAAFGAEVQKRGVAVVAISSNDVEHYPQDGPQKMATEARTAGYTFPYLFDGSQAVAKSYRAACTPDFYLFDGAGRLFYRGQFDASRPRSGDRPTGKDLRDAVDALLAGKPASPTQMPSIGCNIKWKAGNEPDYF